MSELTIVVKAVALVWFWAYFMHVFPDPMAHWWVIPTAVTATAIIVLFTPHSSK